MENQNKVPLLRFPEFLGEWKLIKLGDFFIERNDTNIQDYPLYSLTIENGVVPKNERYERSFLVNDIDNAYKVMHRNDFAFNPMNLRFGALARLKENKNVLVSKYYNIFYCQKNGNSAFFEYYLTSYNMIQYYNKMATGSLVEKKRVHYLDFIHFKKHLPELPEQTQIANFLTEVDNKLTQLKKTKSLLEQYKKGVMQKLFSQELRFKDENEEDFAEWKEKKLGEVANKKSSNIAANKIEENFGDYIIYGASGILKTVDFFEEANDYVSIVKDGAGVGRILYCKGESSVLGTLDIIKPNISINTYFLYCLLSNIDFTKYITGSTIPHIYFKDYKNEDCGIPSLPEQTKIANFLLAIDDKINHCGVQIEKMEGWKKGLLQQMFV